MQNFNEVAIPKALLHRLKQIGFVSPTPIQAKAIPYALQGHDILGSAQTGTGKTGAYGIPLIAQLLSSEQGNALVLLPTRELAIQVMRALQQFINRNANISTALLIGGEHIQKQYKRLKKYPRLIVGTPGRINDHLTRGTLKLNDTKFLVLDEVDRMLDMGFRVQLDTVAKYLTATRQTLMFSATLPKNIRKFTDKYLSDPIRVAVGESHAPAMKVKQSHVKLLESDKYARLLDELEERVGSIIVFVKTKRAADNMANKLQRRGYKVSALHGDLHQSKRNRVILGFRKRDYRILVATNVAARGLDIPHVRHVINYDLPQNPEDYIHRIGRTARAGLTGEAINFLTPSNLTQWKAIQRLLKFGDQDNRMSNQKKNKGRAKSYRQQRHNVSKRKHRSHRRRRNR